MMEYSIERGTNIRTGIISAASNGTLADLSDVAMAVIGSDGVTFSAAMSGSNLQIRFSTTNTGVAATLRRTIRIW